MARRTVVDRNSYRIEFETAGSGCYYLVTQDEEKGPYTTEEAAKRAAAAYLEERLSRPGDQLARQMAEDDDALRRAEERNQARFGQEVSDEVDELIARSRRASAAARLRNRQALEKREAEKNAAPEGKPVVRFKFGRDKE